MDSVDLDILKSSARWLADGHRVLLVTVVKTWGSLPRPVGAMLAVRADAHVLGAVSGGCIEDDLIDRVRQRGILSASVGLSAPESVKGFAVLAGRILPELEPVLASRERLAGLQALIAHGRADDKLPVSWAERAHAWLEDLGVKHELRLYPGGHGISSAMALDFHAWLNEHLPPVAPNALTLNLGPDEVSIVSGHAGDTCLRIGPGIDALVRAHLAQPGALAFKMEAAISAIEDELALVPKALHHATVVSSSPSLRGVARAAGLDETATVLSREAVERVFVRQSAVAQGRPAAYEGLPDDLAFVAGLLLVRELMHHLDIEAISLTT